MSAMYGGAIHGAVYCTRAEVKQAIQKEDSDDDAFLDSLIEDASRSIDQYCRRPDGFVAVATVSVREYGGSGTWSQRIDECVSITLVEVKDSASDSTYTAWAGTDWVAAAGAARNPVYHRLPHDLLLCAAGGAYSAFTAGPGPTVRVTARWGYTVTAPVAIRRATIMQVARWYKRLRSGMSDTLASPELGGVMLYEKGLDPSVAWILDHGWVRYAQGLG